MIAVDSPPLAPKRGGWRELPLVLLSGTALAALFTYPLAFRLGSVARLDNDDARFGIWNVAWVARTIVADPLHLYDANIFYPHRGTLAYSEANLGAGILASPLYWLTRNPYLAHNFVLLLAFVLNAASMYYLVRYLAQDRRAAAVAGICFGFGPYVLSWTAEIQLMMAFGLPFAMLALHRAADRPTAGRGAALGAVMAIQAAFCGYYAVFSLLMIGYASLVVAAARRRWPDREYWTCMAVAAAVAIALVVPQFAPYLLLKRTTGFARSLEDAQRFAADWRGYLASPAVAHGWMLRLLGHWKTVAFPGFLALAFGVAGARTAWSRARELFAIYGGLAAFAFWASFGSAAGFYTLLYRTIPLFAWLRAPARFSLIVVLATCVFAGLGVAGALRRARRPVLLTALLIAAASAESMAPMRWRPVPPPHPAYRVLAMQPPGAVIELPFYYRRMELFGHVKYMLASTAHWKPLVNGYSDYLPPDFIDSLPTLATFPAPNAMRLLEPSHVRYAVFHLDLYNGKNRAETLERIAAAAQRLRPLYADEKVRLYEIVGPY